MLVCIKDIVYPLSKLGLGLDRGDTDVFYGAYLSAVCFALVMQHSKFLIAMADKKPCKYRHWYESQDEDHWSSVKEMDSKQLNSASMMNIFEVDTHQVCTELAALN